MVNFELIFKKDKTQNSLAISSKYTETLKFQWNLPCMPFGNVKNIQLVWCQDFGRIDWTKISFGSFAHLTVLVRDKPQFFKLFAITTWSLWNHRNKCCFNEAIGSLEIIVDSYRNQLLNFKQCREITLKKPRPAKKVWVPPAVDSLKKLYGWSLKNMMKQVLGWCFKILTTTSWRLYQREFWSLLQW